MPAGAEGLRTASKSRIANLRRAVVDVEDAEYKVIATEGPAQEAAA